MPLNQAPLMICLLKFYSLKSIFKISQFHPKNPQINPLIPHKFHTTSFIDLPIKIGSFIFPNTMRKGEKKTYINYLFPGMKIDGSVNVFIKHSILWKLLIQKIEIPPVFLQHHFHVSWNRFFQMKYCLCSGFLSVHLNFSENEKEGKYQFYAECIWIMIWLVIISNLRCNQSLKWNFCANV